MNYQQAEQLLNGIALIAENLKRIADAVDNNLVIQSEQTEVVLSDAFTQTLRGIAVDTMRSELGKDVIDQGVANKLKYDETLRGIQ